MTRDAQRAANRARFPEFADLHDSGTWRLVHAEDAQGEIGKRPTLPPNVVEIDACKAMELAAMGQKAVRR